MLVWTNICSQGSTPTELFRARWTGIWPKTGELNSLTMENEDFKMVNRRIVPYFFAGKYVDMWQVNFWWIIMLNGEIILCRTKGWPFWGVFEMSNDYIGMIPMKAWDWMHCFKVRMVGFQHKQLKGQLVASKNPSDRLEVWYFKTSSQIDVRAVSLFPPFPAHFRPISPNLIFRFMPPCLNQDPMALQPGIDPLRPPVQVRDSDFRFQSWRLVRFIPQWAKLRQPGIGPDRSTIPGVNARLQVGLSWIYCMHIYI